MYLTKLQIQQMGSSISVQSPWTEPNRVQTGAKFSFNLRLEDIAGAQGRESGRSRSSVDDPRAAASAAAEGALSHRPPSPSRSRSPNASQLPMPSINVAGAIADDVKMNRKLLVLRSLSTVALNGRSSSARCGRLWLKCPARAIRYDLV